MKPSLAALGVLLCGLCAMSFAQKGSQDKPGHDNPGHDEDKCCCSTLETNECLGAVEKKVDVDLNDIYQNAWQRSNAATSREGLRKAERAWVAYRDANCDAEVATHAGGSIAPTVLLMCRIKLARERMAEIKRIYLGP